MSKQKPPRTPPPSSRAPVKSAKPAARASVPPSARAAAGNRTDAPKALELAVERLEASVTELRRERDDLATRLAAAQIEIATLDTARKAAIDRIDWVIDSLQSAIQADKS